jgi:hypothetical protein
MSRDNASAKGVDIDSDDLSLGDMSTLSQIFADDARLNESRLFSGNELKFASALEFGDDDYTPTANAQDVRASTPTPMNVLLGRGRHNVRHPGNAFFISLVKEKSEEYYNAKKGDKRLIALEIKNKISEKGGRFDRYDSASQSWVEASSAFALNKISQALRYRICKPEEPYLQTSSEARASSHAVSNRSSLLLSDREILRAVGYNLCPITGAITPLSEEDMMVEDTTSTSKPPYQPKEPDC